MSIYVRGDTHGDFYEFVSIDKILKSGDICIICGDCGLLLRNDKSENSFLDDIEKKDYTILFVDGNHENFPAIYSYKEEIWNGGKIHRIRKNVLHLCRGQVFEIEGKKFFTFGGGYSLDKELRIPLVSWWEEEMPTLEEYAEGRRNLEKHNWKVDYILTHTANIETIKLLAVRDRFCQVKAGAIEEAELDFYLEEIRGRAEYTKWFFGHFHRDLEIEYTRQRAVWTDMIKIDWHE